jgi:dihydrolipoamide dehydrogenase
MKEYDVLVVGSGAGAIIVNQCLVHNLSVAWVDKGPIGGTCLNVGCIPSKILIFVADRVTDIREARKLGIRAEIRGVDFPAVMRRMRALTQESRDHMREGLKRVPGLDFYEAPAQFVDDYTLEVAGERIRGRRIFLVSGARPFIPAIKGLDEVDYLTNETVLELNRKPKSLIIVGGGYIAAEYAHFFSALGTKVTILQRSGRLLRDEEPEIAELLKRQLMKRMKVFTDTEALEARKTKDGCLITAEDRAVRKRVRFRAEAVLIAAGRKSNADLLRVEKTGVETDERNYIRVNDLLETSQKNIWALGDAIGKKMFRHSANHQAGIVWRNSIHGEKNRVDLDGIPHAVFCHPEIASVGLGEAEARKRYDILVGEAEYTDVARGKAMLEEESFAKAIVEKDTWRILGFHIIGSQASLLIQEVVDAMNTGGTAIPIIRGIHIHPALPEVVQASFLGLHEPL